VNTVDVGTEVLASVFAVIRVTAAVLAPLHTAFCIQTFAGRFCGTIITRGVAAAVHPVAGIVAVTVPIAVTAARQFVGLPLHEELVVGVKVTVATGTVIVLLGLVAPEVVLVPLVPLVPATPWIPCMPADPVAPVAPFKVPWLAHVDAPVFL
jgi:hypothetical protein